MLPATVTSGHSAGTEVSRGLGTPRPAKQPTRPEPGAQVRVAHSKDTQHRGQDRAQGTSEPGGEAQEEGCADKTERARVYRDSDD